MTDEYFQARQTFPFAHTAYVAQGPRARDRLFTISVIEMVVTPAFPFLLSSLRRINDSCTITVV